MNYDLYEGKLSIIIPVFNGEKYLSRCLESVIKSVADEIIIINDGSTDKSALIIDSYVEHNPRIKVYHNERNKGVVTARSFGVEKSTGKYIAFVDADDWINADFFLPAIKVMDNNEDYDVSVGCAIYDDDNGNRKYICSIKKEIVMETKDAMESLITWKYYRWELWGKVFRRQLFAGWKPLRKVKVCEDLDSTWKLIKKARKVICIPQDYYYYFFNDNSTTRRINILTSNSWMVYRNIWNDSHKWLNDIARAILKKKYKSCLLGVIRESIYFKKSDKLISFCQEQIKEIIYDRELSKNEKKLYNDPKSAREVFCQFKTDVINVYREARNKNEKVYLYGTGIVSEMVSRILDDMNCPFDGYIVSDDQMKGDLYLEKNVYSISDIYIYSSIILALNNELQIMLQKKLSNDGYIYIYRLNLYDII